MTLFDQIFDPEIRPAIRIAAGDPRIERVPGMPDEETGLKRATERRQREFRTGRMLAREALRSLEVAPAVIPAADDRAPVWPEGIAGSITHCHDLCAAAVARKADGFVSIGLDLEPAEPLDADLVSEICADEERLWLAALPAASRGLFARTIFSAKECAYKCQYPLSGKVLDFHAMTISIDGNAGSFVARFNTDVPPFRTGDRLSGRFAIDGLHVLTAMALTSAALAYRGVHGGGRCP
ncbi:4'-phosphopantetheinyl transferase family protein [Paracoccus denitrificans]|uniref:4'-phosphopantetheinyl transferase family protein n=1 Tax=Paracoccus denitrificans TaxID=266 RepID=UPI000CEC0753|nr:4'-phosphopantetheinyl transferase superfamily protein [Paracoccus denitrificans]